MGLTAEQAGLWAQVDALWQMSLRQDLDAIAEALHPDYSGWVTGLDRPHGYDAAVSSVSPSSPRVLRYALTPVRVTVFGGIAGVAHYVYEAEMEEPPHRIVRGRWTEMYLRDKGRWLMVSVSGGPDGQR